MYELTSEYIHIHIHGYAYFSISKGATIHCANANGRENWDLAQEMMMMMIMIKKSSKQQWYTSNIRDMSDGETFHFSWFVTADAVKNAHNMHNFHMA